MADEERERLLEDVEVEVSDFDESGPKGGLRKRNKEPYKPSWAPGGPDYDPDLPYGPNVYLARKKKPDPWWVKYVEVGLGPLLETNTVSCLMTQK